MSLQELGQHLGIRSGPEDIVFNILGIRRAQTPEQRVSDTVRLFQNARRSIQIFSEKLTSRVYTDQKVIEAIKQVSGRGGVVEIITSQNADKQSLLTLSSQGVLVYVMAKWPIREYDFTVVDVKNAQLVEPRAPAEEKTVVYTSYNYKYAKELSNRFAAFKPKTNL